MAASNVPRIAAINYVGKASAAASLTTFYQAVCGLSQIAAPKKSLLEFRLPGPAADLSAKLSFDLSGSGDAPSADSKLSKKLDKNYWKVGFGADDPAAAVESINAKAGERVLSAAHQFADVGFLCHMGDPTGLTVEVLGSTQLVEDGPSGEASTARAVSDQRRRLSQLAKSRAPPSEGDRPALGQSSFHSVVGQVTLRSSRQGPAVAFWRDLLGMELLCREDVSQHGFTLLFLAFADESEVPADIDAIHVREWIYQLPVTTVEIQVGGSKLGDPIAQAPSYEEVLRSAKLSLEPNPLPALEGRQAIFSGVHVVIPATVYDGLAAKAGNAKAEQLYAVDPDGTPCTLTRGDDARGRKTQRRSGTVVHCLRDSQARSVSRRSRF